MAAIHKLIVYNSSKKINDKFLLYVEIIESMQDSFDIKLFSFNIKSHSDIDIVLDDKTAILICFFNEADDFKQNFYKFSKAALKFQKIHLIFECSESFK